MYPSVSLFNKFPITQLDCKCHEVESWVYFIALSPELVDAMVHGIMDAYWINTNDILLWM